MRSVTCDDFEVWLDLASQGKPEAKLLLKDDKDFQAEVKRYAKRK